MQTTQADELARQTQRDFYANWKRNLTRRQTIIRALNDKRRVLQGITGPIPDAELHILITVWEEHFTGIPDDALIPAAQRAAQQLKPGQSLDAIAIRAAYEEAANEPAPTIDPSDFLTPRPDCVRGKL